MANTEFSLRDINTNLVSQYPAIVRLPKVAAPYTTVVNRAQVTDFSTDLLPRMGVDRFVVQQVVEVQGEYGPNGEQVLKPINDSHDAVRLVGGWFSNVNNSGPYTGSSGGAGNTDYIEITFYGTGLNLLMLNGNGNVRTVAVSVDGGSASSVQWDATANSNIINSRNYAQNAIAQMVSGLSVGLHTVKIQQNNGTNFYFLGYEVINSSTSLQLPSGQSLVGGRRLNKTSLSTAAYNSGFESGTLGTRGGHVVVYQKADGTVAKAVTPTNASAAYLGSADHTNEEVVRVHNFREFGAGRTDDFSNVSTAAVARAFTLDDGTTTLAGTEIALPGGANAGKQAVGPNTNSVGFLTITFVGTGLDIRWIPDSSGTNSNANAFEFILNGVSIGNMDTTAQLQPRVKKIVSGLPYGTHTLKIFRNVPNTWTLYVQDFIVYAPKTPTLPAGAVALADYFVMADYSADLIYGNSYRVSSGVLRKQLIRETTFSGTWASSVDTAFASGFNVRSNTAGSYVEYTFFGTGASFRTFLNNSSYNFTFSVDGAAPGGGSTFTYQGSGLTYTPGTGVLSGTTAGAASYAGGLFQITGLTLGVHKLRVTFNSSADYLYADAFDVITPIHAPKDNGPVVLQNSLPVGSCGVRDLRNFGERQVTPLKSTCQAVGITGTTGTVSTVAIPVGDLCCIVKTKGNPLSIDWNAMVYGDVVGANIVTQIYVDGAPVGSDRVDIQDTANYQKTIGNTITVPVAAGTHIVQVYWYRASGTNIYMYANRRVLTAKEL